MGEIMKAGIMAKLMTNANREEDIEIWDINPTKAIWVRRSPNWDIIWLSQSRKKFRLPRILK